MAVCASRIEQQWISLYLQKHTMKFLWWIHLCVFHELVCTYEVMCTVCITTWNTHHAIVSCKKFFFCLVSFFWLSQNIIPTLYTVMTTSWLLSLSIIVGVCSWLPLCLGHWISLWSLHSASHTASWLGRYAQCWYCVKLHCVSLTKASFPGLGTGNETTLTNEHKVTNTPTKHLPFILMSTTVLYVP